LRPGQVKNGDGVVAGLQRECHQRLRQGPGGILRDGSRLEDVELPTWQMEAAEYLAVHDPLRASTTASYLQS
jgi:hypothetical protein